MQDGARLARTLSHTASYSSRLPPDALIQELRRVTEPHDGSFQLLSRLSGGGVVIRVLKAPKTERPFFGRVGDEGAFRIAMVPRGEALTPYQPILHGRVLPADEGSHVELHMAPHRQARTFSVLFGVAAIILGALSLVRLFAQPLIGCIGLFFAFGFAVFPTLRARQGFGVSIEESLTLLTANVPLTLRV